MHKIKLKLLSNGFLYVHLTIQNKTYGLKIKTKNRKSKISIENQIIQVKKLIAEQVLQNHKILLKGFQPNWTSFFSKDEVNEIISLKYSKKEITKILQRKGFKKYFNTIPKSFYIGK